MRRVPFLGFSMALLMVSLATAAATAQSADPGTAAPAAFTGHISFGECTSESEEVVDGVTQVRGVVCDLPVLDMSDPRLDGHVTLRVNADDHPDGIHLIRCAYRIENDGGAWQQEPSLRLVYPDGSYSTDTIILVGEGGYEGLTAVAEVPLTGDTWSLDGFILDGQVPASPVVIDSPVALAASPRPTIGEAADDGARIVGVDTIDARTRDLTIESPSVGTVKVRLLLPGGFDAAGTEDWPVLYLLHGYGADHAEWTDATDVEELTAPTDLLVVMPDADEGWYTDAWNGGAGGPPAWETFHMTELVQLLERNWQAGDSRVVAGLSMGGLGAMAYAARHPGMFQAAASYSGVLDTIDSGLFRGEAAFGDPVEQADVWTAHNPLDLAPALKGLPLYVSYGDGRPGPLDSPDADPDDVEGWIAPMNDLFVARLDELGIPATVDAYGPGAHDWPYWERALRDSLPMLLEALGEELGGSPKPAASSATR